jgi:hypothetical protein
LLETDQSRKTFFVSMLKSGGGLSIGVQI